MKVSECMTRDVCVIAPNQTLREAALKMAEIDAGVLPVGKNDRLVGMITDRDIAIRGVAADLGPDARIEDVMTDEVQYCFEDDDVDDVLEDMGDIQVRRLPVLNQDKRLVGIVSISDVASSGEAAHAGEALGEIARPSGLHSQAA